MKLLTLNFLTCAVKACKTSPASFPLRTKDCTLEKTELAYQPAFMRNVLPRIDLDAMEEVCAGQLGLKGLMPPREEVERVIERGVRRKERGGGEKKEEGDVQMQEEEAEGDGDGEGQDEEKEEEEILQKLHSLLLETGITEGKLVCGNCGFEYPVKDGVGNFLLPAHLV